MKKPPLTTALTLTILLTFTGSVCAKLRDYKLFRCSAIAQAYQCSAGCYPPPNGDSVNWEFHVNSEKGMVMIGVYQDGKLLQSITKEKCSVFDIKTGIAHID